MGNRVSKIYDTALALRASGTAITSSASETGVAFAARKIVDYKAVVEYNGVVSTGTYVFSIEVSDLVGGTYTEIAGVTIDPAGASGSLQIPLSGKIAELLDADSDFIRVTATLGATSPSIDYDCFLTKN